jgi:hypothetical protein
MSYLKGPLKRDEIKGLMKEQKSLLSTSTHELPNKKETAISEGFTSYSSLDGNITQHYEVNVTDDKRYTPTLMAQCTLNYFNQTRGIDEEENLCLSLNIDTNNNKMDWGNSEQNDDFKNCFSSLPSNAPSEAQFAEVSDILSSDKNLRKATTTLKDWLYHEHKLELFRCKSPKIESAPYESVSDFKIRLTDLLDNKKEQAIEVLQERYAKKEKVLTDRLSRAEEKLEKEESDTSNSFLNVGITVLGALFGKSRASIGRAGSRVLKERGDVNRQEERVEKIKDDIEELEEELEDKVDDFTNEFDIDAVKIEDFAIKLRKTDIQVNDIAVVWRSV